MDTPLGKRYEDALLNAARAKSTALTAEKYSKRVYSQCFLSAEGAVATREHLARVNEKYIAAETDWLQKETDANIAQAQADAIEIQFESWRTMEATKRAEMKL